MKNYWEYKVTAFPFNVDIISSVLWELPILGINEYDTYLTFFCYQDQYDIYDNLLSLLDNLKKEKLVENFSIEKNVLENKNWNEEWEKKIKVIEVSEKIVIKPSFKEYSAKEGQIVITIDPKMSFGTGEHQTTKLMLLLIEKYCRKNDFVLEVGSGTAVLSIAAFKLGACKVIAIDNDEWCLINGKENVEKNNAHAVDVRHSEIKNVSESNFDLVMANINKNILIEIKQNLRSKLKHGGILILSGLLYSDYDSIIDHYTELDFLLIESKQMDEWIGLVFKKN